MQVTYPCYRPKLTVDPAFGALLAHEAPLKAGPNTDLVDVQKIAAEQTQ